MDLRVMPVPHEDGHWINERISRTVELIRGYDPNLDVKWIPPEARDAQDDNPFIVVEKTPDGRELPVFSVPEQLMNEAILERIMMNDASKHGDILSEMDARNKARRAMLMKEQQDKLAEQQDLHKHILKSPKTRYRHNGKVYE